MNNDQTEIINEKLDLIIRLLAIEFVKEYNTQKDRILTLANLNLAPKNIAEILNIPYNTVTARISEYMKSK